MIFSPNMFRSFFLFSVFFLIKNFSFAQCTVDAYGQWPTSTFTPVVDDSWDPVTTSAYSGEYSVVAVEAGQRYQFLSFRNGSGAARFLTITDIFDTPLVWGTTTDAIADSIGWTATFTGNIKFFTHTNSSCGTSTHSSSRYIKALLPPCNAENPPWSDGFEGFYHCWTVENGSWVVANSSSDAYTDPRTDTYYLRQTYSQSNSYVWSPGLSVIGGTEYEFSFYWSGDGYSGWDVDVFYNTSQNSTGATPMGNILSSSTTTVANSYIKETFTFIAPTTDTYHFGLRLSSNITPWYISFDDFNFQQSGAVLPITLSYFGGTCNTDGNDVMWVTSSENNSSHFTLNRSTDGESWEEIGHLEAAGNSSTDIEYNVKDKSGHRNPISYYRLHQFDYNNDSAVYGPISVACDITEENTKGSLSPNPSVEASYLTIENCPLGEATITLMNIAGEVIYTERLVVTKPNDAYFIDALDLARGSYIIRFVAPNNDVISMKLVKN